MRPIVHPGDLLQESATGAAVFSTDGRRRRWLYRSLNPKTTKRVGFIMLNPSNADAVLDDPTIRRCKGFALREGGGSLEVANLLDIIATDPRDLKQHHRRGMLTDWASDQYINHVLGCDLVICAWGSNPLAVGRSLSLIGSRELMCLGKTKLGAPKHPLYLPGAATLERWPAKASSAPGWFAIDTSGP